MCVLCATDKPGPCKNFKTTSVTEDTVGLSWDIPDDNGGKEITNYVLQRREGTKRTWDAVGKPEDVKFDATHLKEGVPYVFQVAAQNEVGVGPFVDMKPVTPKSEHGKWFLITMTS